MCGMFIIIRNEYYLIFVIQEKGGLNSLRRFFNADDHKEFFGASLNEDIFDPVELRGFFQILSDPALLPSYKDSLVILALSGLQKAFDLAFLHPGMCSHSPSFCQLFTYPSTSKIICSINCLLCTFYRHRCFYLSPLQPLKSPL